MTPLVFILPGALLILLACLREVNQKHRVRNGGGLSKFYGPYGAAHLNAFGRLTAGSSEAGCTDKGSPFEPVRNQNIERGYSRRTVTKTGGKFGKVTIAYE